MKKLLTLLAALLLLANHCPAQGRALRRPAPRPFVLGVVDTLQSKVLGETRTLNIYLPAGYSPDSAATYPVIYLLDGSADEDFIHVVGLVQYYTFPWINRLPPSIVVGIANTNRRRDFTSPVASLDFLAAVGFDKSSFPVSGGSAKFIAFIEQELQPFIDQNYKTNPARTLIGQSLGGLLATEILLKKPRLFSTYLILSPSLWWDKESLLNQAPGLVKQPLSSPLKVYVGVGNEGKTMVSDARKLSQTLQQNHGIQVSFDYLPQENHATMTHQALYNAIKLLYPAPASH
jgi:predicted alpha/beta superfamily hydrolase